jgi:dTDP-L-rhamnose 4-epimerase
VYGEGAYRHPAGRVVYPSPRPAAQLQRGDWEIRDPADRALLTPLPTPETAPAEPGSLYAVQKLAQEQMCRLAGDAYGVPVVCLRFFNVYGPRQSLQNPYTGVIGFFATQLLNDRPVNVYEDGLPSRDFVHVFDVARACRLALETDRADGQIVNVGAGERLSLLEIAETMTTVLGGPPPRVSGQYRVGDVRHCYADLRRARAQLGYAPEVDFAGGVTALLQEIIARGAVWADRSAEAAAELRERGLGG